MSNLYWNTVAPILKNVLQDIISEPIFQPFRLVGGTSFNLQIRQLLSKQYISNSIQRNNFNFFHF